MFIEYYYSIDFTEYGVGQLYQNYFNTNKTGQISIIKIMKTLLLKFTILPVLIQIDQCFLNLFFGDPKLRKTTICKDDCDQVNLTERGENIVISKDKKKSLDLESVPDFLIFVSKI